MIAWKCKGCGKQEITRFFKPKWVGWVHTMGRVGRLCDYRAHWIWISSVDEKTRADYGYWEICGRVNKARKFDFEGVPK